MGRRSLISITDINRIISSCNRRKREKEREELINAQQGEAKELPPILSLVKVEFDIYTRNAKIEFLQEQQYRTIVRYVTQNYVRYPIYSEWKKKRKTITKTLKLTNSTLETLNTNNDKLIRMFARDIVASLNNETLFPSWFLVMCLGDAYKEKLENLDNERNIFVSNKEADIRTYNSNIKKNYADIQQSQKQLCEQKRKHLKFGNIYNKMLEAKKSILKSIFTFFVYNALISQKRKDKYKMLFDKSAETIDFLEKSIKLSNESIKASQIKIEQAQVEIQNYDKDLEAKKAIEYKQYMKTLHQVKPLPIGCTNSADFIPLNMLSGFEYTKIIGCYIIHNCENDKYYVGQSKDVIRRIRQHFKGTSPNNIIFAEDYYSVPIEKRDGLFEVKIIECSTKDELDSTEKHLIGKYDAFRSGYNGTNGNT